MVVVLVDVTQFIISNIKYPQFYLLHNVIK